MSLFFIQWRAELWKLIARKRTFLGFGAFLLVEVLLYLMMRGEGGKRWFRMMIQKGGESFDSYYSALTLAFVIVALSTFILGAIYLTLVAGDVVAKESEDGNLRLILARPISRLRLLTLKYLSCMLYTVLLIQFISWSALGLGTLLLGWGGGLFAFVPDQNIMTFFDPQEGLMRYALSTVLMSFSMMTCTAVAFFFSCLKIKPAAATVSALSYLLADSILRQGHFTETYKDYLITRYMSAWALGFNEIIPWPIIIHHFTILAGVSLTLFVVGAAIFESRDVKS